MKKINFFQMNKSIHFFLMLFICITVIFSVMTGCDDDSSNQAKLYDAEKALDKGNWAKAITILESLDESEDVFQYLSNAYAGQVGINTFDLLTTIDELDNDDSGSDNSGSIDMIGTLIGDDNNELTCSTISAQLDIINNSIFNMAQISSQLGQTLNDDQSVQLGLASLTRTVLIIAKLICLETGETKISMTEEWITDYRDANGLVISNDSWATDTYAAMLSEDITNVGNAIASMTGDNDIKEDFEVFKLEIDNGNGATLGDDTIDLSELNYYIDNM